MNDDYELPVERGLRQEIDRDGETERERESRWSHGSLGHDDSLVFQFPMISLTLPYFYFYFLVACSVPIKELLLNR